MSDSRSVSALLSASLMILGVMAGSLEGRADVPSIPQLIPVSPAHVFAPRGFDDNDNAQVVVTGNFPSTCFKTAPPLVEVNHATRVLRIQNRAFFYPTGWCQRMLVPYVQTIDLGILNAKKYDLVIMQDDGSWANRSSITIAQSKNAGPDDYLYAIINEARVEPTAASPAKTLVLTGMLPSACMTLPQIQVIYRASDVIEVLPISSYKEPGKQCPPVTVPFETRVELSPAWEGQTLVHIRSLNGQSLNKIAEFGALQP